MVEVVIVITILATIAALAAPRLMERDAFDQMAVADRLRGSLRYAQRVAMARNREVCVFVTGGGITFLVTQQAGTGMPCIAPVRLASDGQQVDVGVPAGLALAPAIRFRFTGNGRLADDGPTPFQRPAQPISIVRSGVVTTTILVHSENGYVQ